MVQADEPWLVRSTVCVVCDRGPEVLAPRAKLRFPGWQGRSPLSVGKNGAAGTL